MSTILFRFSYIFLISWIKVMRFWELLLFRCLVVRSFLLLTFSGSYCFIGVIMVMRRGGKLLCLVVCFFPGNNAWVVHAESLAAHLKVLFYTYVLVSLDKNSRMIIYSSKFCRCFYVVLQMYTVQDEKSNVSLLFFLLVITCFFCLEASRILS